MLCQCGSQGSVPWPRRHPIPMTLASTQTVAVTCSRLPALVHPALCCQTHLPKHCQVLTASLVSVGLGLAVISGWRAQRNPLEFWRRLSRKVCLSWGFCRQSCTQGPMQPGGTAREGSSWLGRCLLFRGPAQQRGLGGCRQRTITKDLSRGRLHSRNCFSWFWVPRSETPVWAGPRSL